MSIPDHLYKRLHTILARCPALNSAEELRAVFIVDSIAPWANAVSDTPPNRAARVHALISQLHDQANAEDENALVLFLRALLEQEHIPARTADHRDLSALLPELEEALCRTTTVTAPRATSERDSILSGVWWCPTSTDGATRVGSARSDAFHRLNCKHVQSIAGHNRICFRNRSAATTFGKHPCRHCDP